MSISRRAGWLAVVAAWAVSGCTGADSERSSPSTTAPPATTVAAPATTQPTTTLPTTTTTTPSGPTPNPACFVTVRPGDSLGAITARLSGVTIDDVQRENGLSGDVIHPDEQLDICVGNDIDDVTGASRLAPSVEVVMSQQAKLNEIFAPYSLFELAIDGDSGPLTRQMLCAARLGLGLPVTTNHLIPGTDEEEIIMAATDLSLPVGAPTSAAKWIVIDKTCQVLVAGEGDRELVDIYPTSTGTAGYPTQNLGATPAYRYDPAPDNAGWHDSTNFPSAIDDPQNGNMYKPIYFNGGQAIHGANYVPPTPRSKGCARTFPGHQDQLLRWIGLADQTEITWQPSDIGVVVKVQGDYRSS